MLHHIINIIISPYNTTVLKLAETYFSFCV